MIVGWALILFVPFWERGAMWVYEDKIVVHNIGQNRFFTFKPFFILFMIFLSSTTAFFAFRSLGGTRFIFAATGAVSFLIMAYYLQDKGFTINFKTNKIYIDLLIFDYPYKCLWDFGGIDTAFDTPEMSSYFFRLWEKGDRYGWGIVISGLIDIDDSSFEKIFGEMVLSRFEERLRPEIPSEIARPELRREFTVRLKNDNEISRDDLKAVFVYSYFEYIKNKGATYVFVLVAVLNELGDPIYLVRCRPNSRDKIGLYLCELRNKTGRYIRIVVVDNRLSAKGIKKWRTAAVGR
jgi:hypothetical protein